MELSEKIQKIRKNNNLTQEEFAERLFVSRTAVSKWETGRGIPNIDSLQMISKEFNVQLDQLLSSDDIITVAKHEGTEASKKTLSLVNGIIDLCAILAVILPLYRSQIDSVFYSIYLSKLEGWQGIAFWIPPMLLFACGLCEIILERINKVIGPTAMLGLGINAASVILYILCLQPYPAIFFLSLLIVKGITLLKIKN